MSVFKARHRRGGGIAVLEAAVSAITAAEKQEEFRLLARTLLGVPRGGGRGAAGFCVMENNKGENITATTRADQLRQQRSLELQQQQQQQQIRHLQHHQISFGNTMMQSSSSSSSAPLVPSSSNSNNHHNSYMGKDGGGGSGGGGAYDLGELDQALFLYLDGQAATAADHQSSHHQHHQHQHQQDQRHMNNTVGGGSGGIGMSPPTLNIFPSQPMHLHPLNPSSSAAAAAESLSGTDGRVALQQSSNTHASGSKATLNLPATNIKPKPQPSTVPAQPSKSLGIKREGNRKGSTSSSEHDAPKTPDPKTLRRLAQNREAARKSRLRKKAYVQQLESSRIRLSQLEQELQRARAQGIYFGGGGDQGLPVGVANISSDAAMFDLEYARWLEEHHRISCELRAAVQEHLPENELKIYVDNCLSHYDVVMNLTNMIAKTDVFHLYSGMWKTPAERCFLWIGGFRPSEVIKIIIHQIEPLTEHQLLGICQLQQSTQEAEEALSQGLEALHQSLSDTIASDTLSCPPPNMANYMGQMAMAINKLSTFEGFVRQADSLRHQTLHRLHQILTIRQAARCFLAIDEYFHRLRALSSLWMARPRQE